MAKPIKETPILRGKDAEKFSKETSDNVGKQVSELTLARMKKNYAQLKSISKF